MGDERPVADFSDQASAPPPFGGRTRYAVKDPSMEEILTSIRRILSEEQSGSQFLDEPSTELLLDSSMRVPPFGDLPEAAPAFEAKTTTGFYARTTLKASLEPDEDEQPSVADHIQPPEGLIDERVTSEVVNSIGCLLHSIGTENSAEIGRPGLTIEDMVREQLKPMLKAWLETHLPGLVERVVRAEINRLTDIARH